MTVRAPSASLYIYRTPNVPETGASVAAISAPPPASQDQAAGAARTLTPAEQRTVEQLKKRDAEVVQHEEAHYRAAGSYAASGPRYEYERGPDGNRYRVSGHVRIDTRPLPDPEATIRKAEVVKQAALAPQEPSVQDRKVAAEADQMKRTAERLLAAERQKEAAEAAAYRAAGEAPPPEELPGAASGAEAGGEAAGRAENRENNPYAQPLPFTEPIYVNTVV